MQRMETEDEDTSQRVRKFGELAVEREELQCPVAKMLSSKSTCKRPAEEPKTKLM